MQEVFLRMDYRVFQWVNQTLTHSSLDAFFKFWTDFQQTPAFYILLPFLLSFIYWRQKWKGLGVFSGGLIAMALADAINSKVLKPFFARARPFVQLGTDEVTLRIPEAGGFGFPSSHAVDAFCLLAFVSYFYPKLFWPLIGLAFLTAYSRVYSGVHFPADVIVGAGVGLALGQIFARAKKALIFATLALFSLQGQALEDPTKGKPLMPWLWENQFRPTLEMATEKSNLYLLAGGSALTAASFSQDEESKKFAARYITEEQAQIGSKIGGGPPLIGLAVLQIIFDQEEGLAHGRAIALTAASHISIALMAQRERPNKSPTRLSFPSGHVSHTFASATSLAYSYGPWVGTVAYSVATWSALSRLREEAHWISDVVAGATLGIFWGRASALAGKKDKSDQSFYPAPLDDGGLLVYRREF